MVSGQTVHDRSLSCTTNYLVIAGWRKLISFYFFSKSTMFIIFWAQSTDKQEADCLFINQTFVCRTCAKNEDTLVTLAVPPTEPAGTRSWPLQSSCRPTGWTSMPVPDLQATWRGTSTKAVPWASMSPRITSPPVASPVRHVEPPQWPVPGLWITPHPPVFRPFHGWNVIQVLSTTQRRPQSGSAVLPPDRAQPCFPVQSHQMLFQDFHEAKWKSSSTATANSSQTWGRSSPACLVGCFQTSGSQTFLFLHQGP